MVNPERFSEDTDEQMSRVGMGVTYTWESLRETLSKQLIKAKRQELLEQFYISHHQKLTEAFEESLLASKLSLKARAFGQ